MTSFQITCHKLWLAEFKVIEPFRFLHEVVQSVVRIFDHVLVELDAMIYTRATFNVTENIEQNI